MLRCCPSLRVWGAAPACTGVHRGPMASRWAGRASVGGVGMTGGTGRRRAPRATRLLTVAGVALAVVLGTPGPASAHYGWVKPLVTCVTPVSSGSWTAVFG